MFWELSATIIAGLGAAGLVLGLRKIWPHLPKGLVPAAAGAGMLLFQMVSEYQWYAHTRARLPAGAEVIAAYPQSAWYRPWSYAFPAVARFVVLDSAHNAPWQGEESFRQSRLYFFERRMPTQHWPILVDCRSSRQANIPATDGAPDWQETAHSAALASLLCAKEKG